MKTNARRSFKERSRHLLDPTADVLAGAGVHPMLVTAAGLALSIYGATRVAGGALFSGGIFLVLAGICDVLDGALARRSGKESRFGAFIDSNADRVTEFAYFGAVLYYFVSRPQGYHPVQVAAVFVALAGSVLTSYARARAEGLGLDCTVGLMERPERVALLTIGLLLGSRMLTVVMVFLAVSTVSTFLHRVYHVYRITRNTPGMGRGVD